jgi:release factor glutamine methyltransferase
MTREQFKFIINTKAYDEGFYELRGLKITVGKGVFVENYGMDKFLDDILFYIKEKIDLSDNLVMVDMCTGTGMLGIAMAIEAPNSTIYGVEKYEEPFSWTVKNANTFKEQMNKNNSKFIPVMCSVLDSINHLDKLHGQVDFIFASYPCIPIPDDLSQLDILPYDLTALCGGEDGLEVIKEIITASSILLKKGGILLTATPMRMFKYVEPLLDDSVWSETFESPLEFMVAIKK